MASIGCIDSFESWYRYAVPAFAVTARFQAEELFGTRQMLRDIADVTGKFNGATIRSMNQARNLGVIFDQNLDFRLHVDQLVPKCTGMLLALNHAKHVIPMATVKYLITALVFPVMRYCMSVYCICNKTQVHRIQKVDQLRRTHCVGTSEDGPHF